MCERGMEIRVRYYSNSRIMLVINLFFRDYEEAAISGPDVRAAAMH